MRIIRSANDETYLIHSPRWFYATLSERGMRVYASTLVRRSHRWWRQVDHIVEMNGLRLVSEGTIEDEEMFFSEAYYATWQSHGDWESVTE